MLTRIDIIRLGQKAGLADEGAPSIKMDPLERFAALVEAETLKTVTRSEGDVIAAFLERSGQYVTNDASREAAIEAAVLAERAACADLCTDPYYTPDGYGITHADQRCADLISARTQPMRIDDAHKEDGP